jgi:hypothetical protein
VYALYEVYTLFSDAFAGTDYWGMRESTTSCDEANSDLDVDYQRTDYMLIYDDENATPPKTYCNGNNPCCSRLRRCGRIERGLMW